MFCLLPFYSELPESFIAVSDRFCECGWSEIRAVDSCRNLRSLPTNAAFDDIKDVTAILSRRRLHHHNPTRRVVGKSNGIMESLSDDYLMVTKLLEEFGPLAQEPPNLLLLLIQSGFGGLNVHQFLALGNILTWIQSLV